MQSTAVDALVAQIERHIATRGLTVGDRLPTERELGTMFSAARNTVREAIRALKSYGIVETRPKIGAVLIDRRVEAALDIFSFGLPMDRATFEDVQGFRRLIEVGSAERILAGVTAGDIAELREINRGILDASSVEEAARGDFAFHARLLDRCGNATLTGVFRTLAPLICRLMETGKAQGGSLATVEAHNGIIDAVERGDRLGFQYLMDGHLKQGLTYIHLGP